MRNPTKYDAQVITSAHPLFKGLLWASVARSTDETRITLQHIHVEREGIKTVIVATDGKRIHAHTYDPGLIDGDIEPIEPGNYELVTKSGKVIVLAPAIDENMDFPNWRSLIPREMIGFREQTVTKSSVGKIGILSGVLLATEFAIEACGFGCGFGKDEAVRISFCSDSPDSGMYIKHDLGRAVVMPMRLSEDVKGTEREPLSDEESTPATLVEIEEPFEDEDDAGDGLPPFLIREVNPKTKKPKA